MPLPSCVSARLFCREWAAAVREADPDFFNRLVNQQQPEYLWIGCSDSRVPVSNIIHS
jgi:carbonic anhydrase